MTIYRRNVLLYQFQTNLLFHFWLISGSNHCFLTCIQVSHEADKSLCISPIIFIINVIFSYQFLLPRYMLFLFLVLKVAWVSSYGYISCRKYLKLQIVLSFSLGDWKHLYFTFIFKVIFTDYRLKQYCFTLLQFWKRPRKTAI